ncbi:hypothetical protein NLG97_g10496 [Lecanicillium saksenae]|uniref:Uncharacterized protein n=1 Tax=Lecanicillium saksenae TaxID=468837 RepID=A0ACC1QGV7_9HYPO|nr:hypothetical protein NLG97_g10496 [Lecanicillium saksenae]
MNVPCHPRPIEIRFADKLGSCLLRKSASLAERAHIFTAFVYRDPANGSYKVSAYLPEGDSMPDLNGLVADALAERLIKQRTKPTPGESQESFANPPTKVSDGVRDQDNENASSYGPSAIDAEAVRQE